MPMSSLQERDIQLLENFIVEASSICITAHAHPDGDALGSTAALRRFLKLCRGKDAVVVLPDSIPDNLAFITDKASTLVFSDAPDESARAIMSADLIFCLDFCHFTRTGGEAPLLEASSARKVLIDHHDGPDEKDFDLVFSCTRISSASELLYSILKMMEQSLPVEVGAPLMTGMTTDTNNFANSVFPSTLGMASDLLAAGVDRDAILFELYNRFRINRLKAMERFLSKLRVTPCGAAYAVFRREDMEELDIAEGETEGFVNLPLSVDNVRLSIFLKEDNGHFRVSIRSRKGTSALTLARSSFNGGGHECASGGKLFYPGDIPDSDSAEEYIENVTARFMQNRAPEE